MSSHSENKKGIFSTVLYAIVCALVAAVSLITIENLTNEKNILRFDTFLILFLANIPFLHVLKDH